MKIKSFITAIMLTFCLAALSATAFAQRAGGRMGRTGAEASGGARTGNKPSGSHISETQQKNIQKLTSDLQAIKQGSQVTPEMKQALKNDLMAMAEGATKPIVVVAQFGPFTNGHISRLYDHGVIGFPSVARGVRAVRWLVERSRIIV